MNAIINYLQNLFTKPTLLWTPADIVVFVLLSLFAFCLVFIVVWGLCCIIDYVKKKTKKDKKNKIEKE